MDQWDWERVITSEDRNMEFLKDIVKKIVKVLVATKATLNAIFPQLTYSLSENVFFITTQELEDLYPTLSPKEREDRIVREYKTVFLMQIGNVLKSGQKHDGRAPDYDDWTLNGDILLWNDTLQHAFEVSSMGIRVDKDTLKHQFVPL